MDRVAASGKASALGLNIWKAKWQLEVRAYQDARRMLVAAFLDRYKSEAPSIAERCVDESLHEYLGPACASCNGAQELVTGDLRVECQDCHGSGLRRYSDWERAARMKMSLQRIRSLAFKIRWVSEELGSLDRAVNSVLVQELERE